MKSKEEMEFIVNELALLKLDELLNSFNDFKLKTIKVLFKVIN